MMFTQNDVNKLVKNVTEELTKREAKPIDMVLHCPACGLQHIDAPDYEKPAYFDASRGEVITGPDRRPSEGLPWTNPPHRSHLCHNCGFIWRPADVATNGVLAVKTKGSADSELLIAKEHMPCNVGIGEDTAMQKFNKRQ